MLDPACRARLVPHAAHALEWCRILVGVCMPTPAPCTTCRWHWPHAWSGICGASRYMLHVAPDWSWMLDLKCTTGLWTPDPVSRACLVQASHAACSLAQPHVPCAACAPDCSCVLHAECTLLSAPVLSAVCSARTSTCSMWGLFKPHRQHCRPDDRASQGSSRIRAASLTPCCRRLESSLLVVF